LAASGVIVPDYRQCILEALCGDRIGCHTCSYEGTEDALELGLEGSVDFRGWVELQPL
jgi:hypothetical protein